MAAPTSAGKTMVAKYAILNALNSGNKVIITAPTKALCNQHFRDLRLIFPEKVGLITGDTVINSNAMCIVMVTEILQKSIYEDDQKIKNEIKCIIFDEIHYMQNSGISILFLRIKNAN